MLPTPIVRDNEQVYEPAEDSFLLLDCFEQEKEYILNKYADVVPVVVEVGAGTGIVSTFLRQNIVPDGIYMATDLNPHACREVKRTQQENGVDNSIEAMQMSLTSAIQRCRVDVLVFNPPYVPAEEVPPIPRGEDDPRWLDLALCGGPKGMDVTWILLLELESILSDNGSAYILFCARNEPDKVKAEMEARGWNVDEVIKRKAGWEVLSVLRFTRVKQ